MRWPAWIRDRGGASRRANGAHLRVVHDVSEQQQAVWQLPPQKRHLQVVRHLDD